MIFFTQNIPPFNAANGMRVTPCPCELIDNRIGFYLSDFWKEEIEAKGSVVEQIKIEQIKTQTII